jgi:hypothetical protein
MAFSPIGSHILFFYNKEYTGQTCKPPGHAALREKLLCLAVPVL